MVSRQESDEVGPELSELSHRPQIWQKIKSLHLGGSFLLAKVGRHSSRTCNVRGKAHRLGGVSKHMMMTTMITTRH